MAIVLASGSPRRRELMEMLGVRDLLIIPAVGEEKKLPGRAPDETVKALSAAKALEVAEKRPPSDIVIGADTVVALGCEILGKPRDICDAKRMLRQLSGREHIVWSGVTVMRNGVAHTEAEQTLVRFRPLTDGEIDVYVETGEPMDKAGAYAAQGKASLFVESITGDFFNVMGLPLCRLGIMLKKLGVELL